MVREIHQQQGFPFDAVAGERDLDLLAGGTAVEGAVVVVQLLVGHVHFVRRELPIYLSGKDGQQFRASGLFPLLHGRDLLPVCRFQQGRQGVRRYFAFVVVRFAGFLGVQTQQATGEKE